MDPVLKGMIDIQKKTAHDLGVLEAARRIIEIAYVESPSNSEVEAAVAAINGAGPVDRALAQAILRLGYYQASNTLISKIKQEYNLT
jgi:hypothetical protein